MSAGRCRMRRAGCWPCSLVARCARAGLGAPTPQTEHRRHRRRSDVPDLRHPAGAGRIAAGPAREGLRRQADRRRQDARPRSRTRWSPSTGAEVLALPGGSGFDLSAYLVPAIAFVVAAVALAFGVRRWRRAGAAARDRRRRPPRAPARARTPSGSTPTSPATTSRREVSSTTTRPATGTGRLAQDARSAAAAGDRASARRERPRRRAPRRRSSGGPSSDEQRRRRRAGSSIAWRARAEPSSGRSRAAAALGGPPATMQTSGSVAPAPSRARRGRAAAGSPAPPPRRAGTRAGPGAAARPSALGQPRRGEVALEQRRARARRGRGGGEARPPPRACRSPAPVTSTDRRRASSSSRPSKASRSPRRSVPGPQVGATTGRGISASDLHIRSGAEMPSRPSAPAIVRFVSRQSASRDALDPLPLGADHLAVAVEGVEVGGDRGRVGADPVRGAARGRLADLVGELEQALDQRLLGRLQRRARASASPAAAGGRLARVPGLAQDAGDPGVRVLDVVDGVVAGLAAGQLEVEVDRWCRGCARA